MKEIKMINQILMTLFLALSSLYSTEDMQRDAGSEEWLYPISIGTKILMNLGEMLPLDQQGAEIYKDLRSFNHFINRMLTKEESCQQQKFQQELDNIINTLERINSESFFSQEIQEISSMLTSDFSTMKENLETERDLEKFIVETVPKIAVKEFLGRYKGIEEKSTRCNECHRGYFKQRSGSRGKIECLLCNHQQILSQSVVTVPTKVPVKQITGSFDGLKSNAAFQSFAFDISHTTAIFEGHSLGGALAAMAGNILERKAELERFKTILIQSQSVIEQAKGQNIVFILGSTGAGKSTVINYLSGIKLIKKRNGLGRYVIEPEDDTAGPKIGHGAFSVTMYPSLYTLRDQSLMLCDCPGFADTRGVESEIYISIILQMIASHARSIKCVTIFRDTEMSWARGSLFTNLLSMLNSIFKTGTVNPPLMFVVNKTSSHMEEMEILAMLHQHIENLSSSLVTLLSDRFNLRHNTEMVNVLDNGESRNKLLQELKQLLPIETRNINFFGNTRNSFILKELMKQITSQIITTLEHKENLILRLKYYEKKQKEIANQLSHLERLKFQATALSYSNFSQQSETHRLLQRKEEEKSFLEREMLRLQQMKEAMSNDQSVCVLWSEGFSDVLGRTSKTFYYPLKMPFSYVQENIGAGYFSQRCVNPAEGIYQATYVPNFRLGNSSLWPFGFLASTLSDRANVTIYGKYNQQPEIKQKIQQTEIELQKKKLHRDVLINDISILRSSLEDLIKKQTTTQQEETIRQQEKIINLQNQKSLLENSSKLTQKIFGQNQSHYEDQEKLAEMLVPLADHTDREVIGSSYSMLQELKVMQQSHEDRKSLIPPFIIEPKQTRCGHLFNSLEITEWLMSNQSCPTCSTPTTLEELKSLSLDPL